MSLQHRSSEKRRIYHEFRRQEEEVIGSLCRLGSRPISPKTQLEQEKRIRREIANSNERRRMQSINAGFQSLRTLLPQSEGEKLSKAAILQHTSEFIYQLEQDKTRLLSQNCQLKRLLNNQFSQDSDGSSLDSPLPKRKKPEPLPVDPDQTDSKAWKNQAAESSDEGIGNMSPSGKESNMEELRREVHELRMQLDRERRLRMLMEDEHQAGVEVMYNDKIRGIDERIQYRYQTEDDEAFADEDKADQDILDEDDIKSPLTPSTPEEIPFEIRVVEEIPEDLSGKPLAVEASNVASRCSSPTLKQHQAPTSTVLHILTATPPYQQSEQELAASEEVVLHIPDDNMHFYQPETQMHPAVTDQMRIYPNSSVSTSRQNLETIVEAIRHLEGDHMFCDDPEPIGPMACVEVTSTPLVEDEDNSSATLRANNNQGSSGLQRVVAIPSGGHEYAVRHQVIHCSTSNSMRPGVIVVANHT